MHVRQEEGVDGLDGFAELGDGDAFLGVQDKDAVEQGLDAVRDRQRLAEEVGVPSVLHKAMVCVGAACPGVAASDKVDEDNAQSPDGACFRRVVCVVRVLDGEWHLSATF